MPDAREAVWIALADLFLDTDVRIWYAYVSRVLAESPFSLAELRYILDNEVTPALQGNLLDIAGEWAAFDDVWVVDQIRKGLGKVRIVQVNMDRDWIPVSRLAERLRAIPADEILPRSLAWNALISLITSKRTDVRGMHPPLQYSLGELECFFRQDLRPVLIEGARRLAVKNPRIYPGEDEIEENWTRFAAAFGRPES